MPIKVRELSPTEVRRLSHSVSKTTGKEYNALHPVGGVAGLLLQVTPTGAKSWVYRTRIGTKRRSIGLGGFPDVTLAQARDKARAVRDKIDNGINPLDEKRALKLDLLRAEQRNKTFKQVAAECYKVKIKEFDNAKHALQWWNTLDKHAFPAIGKMSINDIVINDVVDLLKAIWQTTPDTAERLRQRIASVFDYALAGDHPIRANPVNPATKSNTSKFLPSFKKVKKKTGKAGRHHAALPFGELPRLMEYLRTRKGMGGKALEFQILTTSRSGEVRGATWAEIDLKAKVWQLTADRMKADRPHAIPLCDEAVKLLQDLPHGAPDAVVFPSPEGKPMSDMALSKLLKDAHTKELKIGGKGFTDPAQDERIITPHGTARSSFKEWARKATRYPDEWSELALAHVNSDETRSAYARDELLSERREMMREWGKYCYHGKAKEEGGSVSNSGEART